MKQRYDEYMWSKMPFGKHKGRCIKDVPEDYLKWVVMNHCDAGVATMASVELQRRNPKLRK